MNLRTFVAIELTRPIRTAAAKLIRQLEESGVKVKWVDAQRTHLTLKFLGDVEANEINEVCAAVGQAAARHPAFGIHVGGAGAFPDLRRPRVVWLGVTEGRGPLADLHADLETGLAELGYRAEMRRFQPHITLGRLRQGRGDLSSLAGRIESRADFDAGSMPVDRLVVFSSQLLSTGPEYTPLATLPLAKTGPSAE